MEMREDTRPGRPAGEYLEPMYAEALRKHGHRAKLLEELAAAHLPSSPSHISEVLGLKRSASEELHEFLTKRATRILMEDPTILRKQKRRGRGVFKVVEVEKALVEKHAFEPERARRIAPYVVEVWYD